VRDGGTRPRKRTKLRQVADTETGRSA